MYVIYGSMWFELTFWENNKTTQRRHDDSTTPVLLLCVTTTPKHLSVNHLNYPITIVNLLCDITAGWQLGSPLLSFLFFFFPLFFSFLELVPYLRLRRHTSHFLGEQEVGELEENSVFGRFQERPKMCQRSSQR
jgi:hypothetical protein